VAIGLYLLLSVLLGGWPGSRFNRERFLLGCLAGIFLAQFKPSQVMLLREDSTMAQRRVW
jgi:hypothetical protein